MSSDLDALLATILKFPDEDTARLVYADWLDEHAGTNGYSPCPECKGEGRPARQYPLLCRKCGGTGLVPASDGFAERAEFIRAECELARLHDAGHGTQPESGPVCPMHSFARRSPRIGAQVMASCAACARAFEAEARTDELLTDARRAEWSGIPCPACEGGMLDDPSCPDTIWCDNCTGTGFAPVEFRRGFVERVRCRMDDVLRHSHATPTGTVYHLTDWARGILAAHPVTRWEFTDRRPVDDAGVGSYGGEQPGPATKWTWVRSSGAVQWEVPEPVYQFCADHYDSPELARDALALAVGRVARRLAGLPEVTT